MSSDDLHADWLALRNLRWGSHRGLESIGSGRVQKPNQISRVR
jgi:hypothetical protein